MGSTRNLLLPCDDRTRDRVLWFLVAGLFVLRVPFLGGMRYFTWTSTSSWVMPIFEVGTYLFTAILIWMERDHLSDYHVDRLALFILIIGKPAELLWSHFPGSMGRYLTSEQIIRRQLLQDPVYLLYLPISIGLLVGLRVARVKVGKFGSKKWLWVGIGVVTGVMTGVLCAWLTKSYYRPSRMQLPLAALILMPVQEMLYAGIAEEPFFRGFLWGGLRKGEWREEWVLVVQGIMFWIAHIYLIEQRSPMTFWVTVPFVGLVLGLLAWRSRSIGVSMVAHGLVNGVLKIVVLYRL